MKIQIALFFADGRAYFLGVILVIVGLLLLAGRKTRKPTRRPRILLIAGALIILLSSTPAPIWFYALWLIVTIGWLIHHAEPILKPGAGIALRFGSLLFCVAAIAMEVPYRLMPKLEPQGPGKVYVIGDSLSAGTGSGEKTWPKVLAAGGGVEVVDLSAPGATAGTAMAQAQQVPQGPAIVVVEIGGNDLLGGPSNGDFERDLRQLLQALKAPSRRIVMFELPLPPFCNGYGRIQRRLASEFDAVLIPKRVLAGVIGSARGTLDGLHLSEEGHREIADTVRRIIGPSAAAAAPAPQ